MHRMRLLANEAMQADADAGAGGRAPLRLSVRLMADRKRATSFDVAVAVLLHSNECRTHIITQRTAESSPTQPPNSVLPKRCMKSIDTRPGGHVLDRYTASLGSPVLLRLVRALRQNMFCAQEHQLR